MLSPHFANTFLHVKSPTLYLLAAPLTAVLLGFGRVEAQPDAPRPIDSELEKRGEKIVQYLRDNNLQNVGVLKFRVELPDQAPTFLAGALNAHMAERLENALIINLKKDDNIRVLHGAGNVIAQNDKRLSYLDPADVKKIFSFQYPVAWGKDRVQPNVFLTGTVRFVRVPGVNKPVVEEVTVQALDSKGKWSVVHSFKPATDSGILADIGMTRRSRPGGDAVADFDNVTQYKGKEEPDPSLSPEKSKVKLKAFYGDKVHDPVPDNDNPGRERLPEPKQGNQTVKFHVQNQFEETIALVVLVNGLNTLDREIKKDPTMYRMWVLKPSNDVYLIAGYYTQKGKGNDHDLDKFRTFSDEEWEALKVDMPDPGMVELLVFLPAKEKKPIVKAPETEPTMKISLRSLSKSNAFVNRETLTREQLKFNLNQASGINIPRGGLKPNHPAYEEKQQFMVRGGLGGSGQAVQQVLDTLPFPDAVLVERRFIRFWAPKSK